MVTQVHSTHIFELAKQIHTERLHEAQLAHLVAHQKPRLAISFGNISARFASLVALWPARLRSRSQSLA